MMISASLNIKILFVIIGLQLSFLNLWSLYCIPLNMRIQDSLFTAPNTSIIYPINELENNVITIPNIALSERREIGEIDGGRASF